MTQVHLTIGKMPNDVYKIAFDTVDGKLVGEVSVRRGGQPDTRSDEEKKQIALGKFKALAHALDEAIIEEL